MRLFYALVIFLFAATLMPSNAHARVFVGVNIGAGAYYPGGYYRPYYPGYYYGPPVVYAPPPVVYAAPPAPQVIYTTPPTTFADQTSPTYTDASGRTCRDFSSYQGNGTACLYNDGTWHAVP